MGLRRLQFAVCNNIFTFIRRIDSTINTEEEEAQRNINRPIAKIAIATFKRT